MFLNYSLFLLFLILFFVNAKRKCFRQMRGTKTFISTNSQENDDILIELEPINEEENNENKIINNLTTSSELQQLDDQQKLKKQNIGTSIRPASHDVYLWPSMTEHEKTIIRNAFFQIHRRTCIKFNELNYKPWYHAERWTEGKPYVVIRKSYSDNNIEDVNRRSLIYLSEQSLNIQNINNSRGMVMEQLLKFMGYREEFLRPDAPSYIQPIISDNSIPKNTPKFSNEQLIEWFQLTIYCQARRNADIGAGQRTGLLTRWDAVKLNSMYCPQSVGYADPRMGPCVVPRKPKI